MFTPFSGWLFDAAVVGDPGIVTSPPYDVIDDDERSELLAVSPYNIVRLLLPGTEAEDVAVAADLLEQWGRDGTLRRDAAPRFYLYETEYSGNDGARHTAHGLIGALELREFGDGVVPHEETISKHREGRLAVLRATQANLDPIIALSAAPELPGLLTPPAEGPRIDFRGPGGSRHRLYDVTDGETAAAVERAIAAHPVAIADGHHRYSTALGYRKERTRGEGPGPWDSIMALLAPAEGSGLAIGPYHRVLRKALEDVDAAAESFTITPAPPEPPVDPGDIVAVCDGRAWLLRPHGPVFDSLPEPYRLSSTAVAESVLYPLVGIDEKDATYTADAAEASAMAARGGGTAILVAPLPEHAVAVAGEMGLKFPTKSTFFTPKPRAGLVLRRLASS